jgi:hypothetical protein
VSLRVLKDDPCKLAARVLLYIYTQVVEQERRALRLRWAEINKGHAGKGAWRVARMRRHSVLFCCCCFDHIDKCVRIGTGQYLVTCRQLTEFDPSHLVTYNLHAHSCVSRDITRVCRLKGF